MSIAIIFISISVSCVLGFILCALFTNAKQAGYIDLIGILVDVIELTVERLEEDGSYASLCQHLKSTVNKVTSILFGGGIDEI